MRKNWEDNEKKRKAGSARGLLVLSELVLVSLFKAGPAFAAGCLIEEEGVPPQLSGLACVLVSLLKTGLDLSLAVGSIFFIVGGVKYATATGDPKALDGAKRTLTYAILGLVLVIGARAIITLVANLLGVPQYDFWRKVFLPS